VTSLKALTLHLHGSGLSCFWLSCRATYCTDFFTLLSKPYCLYLALALSHNDVRLCWMTRCSLRFVKTRNTCTFYSWVCSHYTQSQSSWHFLFHNAHHNLLKYFLIALPSPFFWVLTSLPPSIWRNSQSSPQ